MDSGGVCQTQWADALFRTVAGDVDGVILTVEILVRRPLFRDEVANIIGNVELVGVRRGDFVGDDFRRLFNRFQPAESVSVSRANPIAVQSSGGVSERLKEAQGRRRPFGFAVVAASVKFSVEKADADAEVFEHGGG